jgi:hypothetical protein
MVGLQPAVPSIEAFLIGRPKPANQSLSVQKNFQPTFFFYTSRAARRRHHLLLPKGCS